MNTAMNTDSHPRQTVVFSNASFAALRFGSSLGGAHHPVNSYLVITPLGRVLIDPAEDLWPQHLPQKPDVVWITHTQREHVAGAANFSDVPLHVPAGDEYLYRGHAAYEAMNLTWQPPWDWETRGNYQGHCAGARSERPPQNALAVGGVIRAGDELFGLKVFATPGHGKNALSFLLEIEDRKIAFCGDLICGEGQLWNWFDCDWDYGLQSGQRSLLQSAHALARQKPDVLLPAHGEPILDATRTLTLLAARLEAVLHDEAPEVAPLNFPDNDQPCDGWRKLLPRLFQWKSGNCAALISQSGHALLFDDGLCNWSPVETRADFHDRTLTNFKAALPESLKPARIEAVAVTHYHGDHIENIPDLIALENSELLCLESVADIIERPADFNLACTLPWYGAAHQAVPVTHRLPH